MVNLKHKQNETTITARFSATVSPHISCNIGSGLQILICGFLIKGL